MARLTHLDMSRLCANLAQRSAHWAGDLLGLPEDQDQPVSDGSVQRFLEEMRGMIDHIERRAASLPSDSKEG